MSEPLKQIIYGEAVFTRTSTGGANGYRYSSPRWACDECGVAGYGDEFLPAEWARPHARGHKPCPHCGKLLTVVMSGESRVHAQCPNRPEELATAWLDAKGNLVVTRREVAEGATV